MKNSIIILLFLSLGSIVFASSDPIKSKLNAVTVYAQGAQLHHKASFSYVKGINEIILEGISPFIDARSIQVSAKGTGEIIILDSKFTTFYPETPQSTKDAAMIKLEKSIALLLDSMQNLDYDIRETNDELTLLNSTKNIIIQNGIMRNQGKVNDSIELLKLAVTYYADKISSLNKSILILDKKRSKQNKLKSEMNERYQHLENLKRQGGQKTQKAPVPRIVVSLQAKQTGSGSVEFSYVARNAGWTPLYDLRSDSQSGKLNLTYKAQVYQNTGLDWKNIALSISTNNPNANKTKPELNPWYINYMNTRAVTNKKTRNLDYLSQPQMVPNQVYNQGFAYESLTESADEEVPALTSNQFTTVVHHLIAAEFKIDLPYTIPSNNEQHMVLIKQEELNTSFKYFAVPKMDAGVYLVAQMTKMDELQLVPASANIFFDGTYIGQTYIDPTQMDDTLNLSLGKDPNIVVKRTLLKKDCKNKIISDKKERTLAYHFEVKNNKSSDIELVVQDQIPLTTNSEITINTIELSKGKLDELTGLVEWEFKLKPRQSEEFDFKFKIKHDKDKQINF